MKIIVTGGAGFIGSNFIRYWLDKYQDEIINLDKLTYCGNLENLKGIEDKKNYRFVKGDICDFEFVNRLFKDEEPDVVINFAAESHNSYAIINPSIFFKTNLIGTQTLLEACRKNNVGRMHHVGTCEIFGDLDLDSNEKFTEESPLRPNTPYNASKAAADLAVRAYFKTFNLPVTVSNCGNNYGPYQFPEKLIPLFITNLLDNKRVPLYKSSKNKREWIHVLDHCKALDLILKKGVIGETYNIGTEDEKSVEEITSVILEKLGKDESYKKYVEDRPQHDRRYLLDSTKMMLLGWTPLIKFEDGISETVNWYKKNRVWWESLKEKRKVKEEKW